MIACPKCNSYMFAGRKGSVQIDCCSNCKGIWLDSGELAEIARTPVDIPEERQEISGTVFPCPRCGQRLCTQPYSSRDPLMVDVCTSCRGVYLDKGELEKIQLLRPADRCCIYACATGTNV